MITRVFDFIVMMINQLITDNGQGEKFSNNRIADQSLKT